MRVSLAQPKAAPAAPRAPLLDPRGARVILGNRAELPARPLAPSASSLFGPRGACLAAPEGPLFVCDTGHHRVLVWLRRPTEDNTPADLVLGQPDFAAEGPGYLHMPTGVAVEGDTLAVADAWHHRVLLWHGFPTRSNEPADAALEGLNWPYGVSLQDGRIYVADTGNRRVLEWPGRVVAEGLRWPHAVTMGDRLLIADAGANRVLGLDVPLALNMPYGVALLDGCVVIADTANSRLVGVGGQKIRLAAQESFAGTGENRWGPMARDSLCWPYAVAACGRTLVVADTGNNRVMLWEAA